MQAAEGHATTMTSESLRLALLVLVAPLPLAAACAGPSGHPNLPPPEYYEWPSAAAAAEGGAPPQSVPLADTDASVDVARREIHE
jgi:hypothetical protein